MSWQELSVFTEYEIQQGKAPLYAFPVSGQTKMPDYLVIDPVHGCIWGEVENSKKSTKDRQFLTRWLLSVTQSADGELPEIGPGVFLRFVEFIAPESFRNDLGSWLVACYVEQGFSENDALENMRDFLGYWVNISGGK